MSAVEVVMKIIDLIHMQVGVRPKTLRLPNELWSAVYIELTNKGAYATVTIPGSWHSISLNGVELKVE